MSTVAIPYPPARTRHRLAGRIGGLVRGRTEDPAWARPALIGLLVLTAGGYLWNLTASGDANSFYAAAVQAGTKSWKAFFFGSLDSSNFITVDKPPASLWVMALSGRIFGFGSLSMLAPQVLEGVLAVGLLYGAIKRWFGPGAGLLAGGLLAITPVAALMFRFNNPDALLVCLLVGSGYCLVRALEAASTRWVLAAGTLVGFAFLAKMGQALLVVPGYALVYLLAAPTGLGRRLRQTAAGGLAILVSAGWWVAVVALWPVGSRPMIDGSRDNSILNLITGYNGLSRIFGASGPAGGGGPGGGGANFSGSTGLLRLFNDLMGGQASWLLPAALLALGLGLWTTRHAPRTDRHRAAVLLWGSWLAVTGLVFSLASGIIHTYYTVALAPAIAAVLAIGTATLWRAGQHSGARTAMAAGVGLTAIWSWVLLDRTPGWMPWLRYAILIAGVLAVTGLLKGSWPARPAIRARAVIAGLAAVACLGGPLAYTIQTLSTRHTGSTPSAGPASTTGFRPGGFPGGRTASLRFRLPGSARARGLGERGSSAPGSRQFGAAGQSTSPALVRALKSGAERYRWVAAVSGSQSAASLELATDGDPVMAIGGFSGQGGLLSLAQFKHYVANKEIHYYIVGGQGPGALGGGPGGGPGRSAASAGGPSSARSAQTPGPPLGLSTGTGGGKDVPGGGGVGGAASSTTAITRWVEAHFKRETLGGQTVYNLTEPKG